MNYAGLRKCDIANGEGVRVSLFVSGCSHHCKGCFNKEAQAFDYGQVFDESVENEIFEALKPSFITGLTILGGEPMEIPNQRALAPFVRRFREEFGSTRTLWIYTGCTLEQLKDEASKWHCEVTEEILSMTDVLVDGPFIEELKDISLRFRGSSNQRIINLKNENI